MYQSAMHSDASPMYGRQIDLQDPRKQMGIVILSIQVTSAHQLRKLRMAGMIRATCLPATCHLQIYRSKQAMQATTCSGVLLCTFWYYPKFHRKKEASSVTSYY